MLNCILNQVLTRLNLFEPRLTILLIYLFTSILHRMSFLFSKNNHLQIGSKHFSSSFHSNSIFFISPFYWDFTAEWKYQTHAFYLFWRKLPLSSEKYKKYKIMIYLTFFTQFLLPQLPDPLNIPHQLHPDLYQL